MQLKDIITIVLGSGVVSGFVNYWLNARRSDKETLRTGLGNLLGALNGYHLSADRVTARLITALHQPGSDVSVVRKQILDDFHALLPHYFTVTSLIVQSFPKLESSWFSLTKQFEEIHTRGVKAIDLLGAGEDVTEYQKSLPLEREKFYNELRIFTDHIREIARKLRPSGDC